MIKVSVLYPNDEGSRFDMDYYLAMHIPLVESKLGDACRQITVEAGLSGAAPDAKPPFACAGHMLFDSVEAYLEAFGPHVEAIMGDIPNYTDVEPVVQVGEVKL